MSDYLDNGEGWIAPKKVNGKLYGLWPQSMLKQNYLQRHILKTPRKTLCKTMVRGGERLNSALKATGRGILAKGKPETDMKGEECRTYQISRMGDSCSAGFFAKTGLSRSRSGLWFRGA